MTPDEIRDTYDKHYAANYNTAFRDHPLSGKLSENETRILGLLLDDGGPWLDVGCGNGYLLSRFPHIERLGLDISPAMLAEARKANPTAQFVEGDFLANRPEWQRRFQVVTCFGHAYGLVNSIQDIERLLNNMADWTSENGRLFLAVSDPRDFAGNFPEQQNWWDNAVVRITSITWDYKERTLTGDKIHRHVISPTLSVLKDMLELRFTSVTEVRYGMPGLLATKKK